jgi:hypothetical protein
MGALARTRWNTRLVLSIRGVSLRTRQALGMRISPTRTGLALLPPRPNLEQYKKLARDLQYACKSGDPGAIRDWAVHWAETIARLQGQEVTPERRRKIDVEAERIAHRWRKFKKANEHAAR